MHDRSCQSSACTPAWKQPGVTGPAPRQQAAAVWIGSGMLAWGGHGATADLDDGAVYDPTTDAWSAPLGTAGAPSPRVAAGAAWTGSEVVVWGGGVFGSKFGLATGARYVPSTGTWAGATAMKNAPSARRNPLLLWTGARVLVWGGDANNKPLSGGGLYDPAGDAWTSIATPGAPSARSGAAYAWSGAELYVVGGQPNGAGASSEAFAYNPVTNAWRTLPTAGAPSARFDAFAVWAGGTLVVVGGRNASGAALATGARYDAANGTWSAIPDLPVAGRAAPRGQVGIAAWSGTAGIFLGGMTASVLRDGALYRPSDDTWPAPIPAWPSNAEHRFGAAIWSGREILLWSGLDGAALTSVVERYKP
jgi:hypothetical protein